MKESTVVNIRMSLAEKEMIQKEVEKGGFKSISDYVRYKIFRASDEKEILKRLETIEDKLD